MFTRFYTSPGIAGAVVGRYNDRFSAKEGICLLLDGCKATIEVNVHDSRGIKI